MIEIKLYFEHGTDSGAILEALKMLPEPIRPVYFAEDEGKIIKANRLDDLARFQVFLKRNAIGFFLYTKNKTCINLSMSRVGHVEVDFSLADDLQSEWPPMIFRSLACCNPVFGYACQDLEYKHRNRHYITLGKNHIESWIGRKLDKYISGVYWLTLLSDSLLAKHGVKLPDLASEAVDNETLGNGSLHLLKFFGKPEDWKNNADRLDDLCERVDGVFSRRALEAAVAGVTSYMDYDEIVDRWR